MGFLGDYKLEIIAPSPGERKVVFPKIQSEKWVSKFDFEEELIDPYYYIGAISISLSEEYYFLMMNENDFTNSNPNYSFENLLSKEEFESLPYAVYARDFYLRPHVFNSGWEETINPMHLNTLNNAILRVFEKEQGGELENKNLIFEDAKKVKLFCEFAIFYFVRPSLIVI